LLLVGNRAVFWHPSFLRCTSAMLEVTFDGAQEGIYIQDKMQACSKFKVRTLISSKLMTEMLFAGDSLTDIQNLIDKFTIAASQFSLKINIKKTVFLPTS